MNGFPFQQLPATQEIDPFELLNQQHTQQLAGIEDMFAGEEQRVYADVQYQLNTLRQKHQVELATLEKLRRYLKPEVYQQRLIALSNKHNLQVITAKEKVSPDVDKINAQKQDMFKRAEFNRATKEVRLNQIRELAEKGIIQDPYAALQEQLQIVGYSYPISALRPPDPMELARRQAREAALAALPTYPAAKKKATKISGAVARRAMKKPGTMAEGIQQIKVKSLPVQRAGVLIPRTGKKLDAVIAKAILEEAGGDKELARIIAKGRGYKL